MCIRFSHGLSNITGLIKMIRREFRLHESSKILSQDGNIMIFYLFNGDIFSIDSEIFDVKCDKLSVVDTLIHHVLLVDREVIIDKIVRMGESTLEPITVLTQLYPIQMKETSPDKEIKSGYTVKINLVEQNTNSWILPDKLGKLVKSNHLFCTSYKEGHPKDMNIPGISASYLNLTISYDSESVIKTLNPTIDIKDIKLFIVVDEKYPLLISDN